MKNIDEYLEIAKTKYNDKFYFYKNDQIIGNSLRYYGEYQQKEVDMLEHYIDSDSVVYDVGGNIGTHSSGFAAVADHVYTFEANPMHFEVLKRNLGNKENVTLINKAVSNTNGTLFIEEFDLDQVQNYGNITVGEEGNEEIECIKLDDADLPPPTVIKIDVEGHELSVLKGAEAIIAKYKPTIHFEASETEDLNEIVAFLTKYDYTCVWFWCANYNPENFYGEKRNMFGQGTIFSTVAVSDQSKLHPGRHHKVLPDDSVQNALNRILADQQKTKKRSLQDQLNKETEYSR